MMYTCKDDDKTNLLWKTGNICHIIILGKFPLS